MNIIKKNNNNFIHEIVALIEDTKKQVVVQANSSLTLLYWHIGKRINTEILNSNRAEYGKQIVVSLSRELVEKFGNNFSEKNLWRMMQFAEIYTDYEKVVTLSRHLSWSHFLVLIPLKNKVSGDFYANLVVDNNMGVRELRKQISKKAFERTRNADVQIYESSKIEKGIFKDPYLLDFLDLKDGYLENDLEAAILKELELFLLELGTGFTFVQRQKRMIIDGDDYYLDLLFYHRKIKRLVAIELKIDKFKPSIKDKWNYTLNG